MELQTTRQEFTFNLDKSPEEKRKTQAIYFLSAHYKQKDIIRVVSKSEQDEKGKWIPMGWGKAYMVSDLIDRIVKAEKVEDVFEDFNPLAGIWITLNPCTKPFNENVTAYRNILIEADDIPIEDQTRLLKELEVPYQSLVFTGKRSIHATIPLANVNDEDTYRSIFESLRDKLRAKGFPVDGSNINPSRMTRLPGVPRGDSYQELVDTGMGYIDAKTFNFKKRKPYTPKPKPKRSKEKQDKIISFCERALNAIDPNLLDYSEWYKISVAFQNEGGSKEFWIEWCNRQPEKAIGLDKKWEDLATRNYRGRPATYVHLKNMAKYLDPNFDTRIEPLDPNDPNNKEEEDKFDVIEEGKFCIDILHAVRLDKKTLYIYTTEDGFTSDTDIIISEIGSLYEGREQRPHVIKELMDYMKVYAPAIKEAHHKYIQFKNGILDTKTKEFMPLTPDLFIRHKIPWDYNPKATPVEIVDKVLNDWSCGDAETRLLMLEIAGYCLLRYTPIHAFFLIIGEKRNGKSVFCDWIRELVGLLNASGIALKDLGERFKSAAYADKLANICDENKGMRMGEATSLKAVSAGGSIEVEHKGQESIFVKTFCKMIFAFNNGFSIEDMTGALKERMNVVLFKASFVDRSKQDHSLLSKLCEPEAMEYFASLAVEALWGVLERGRFTLPACSAEWIEEQDFTNNPLKRFIKDVEQGEPLFTSDGEVLENQDFWTSYNTKVILDVYWTWCSDNDVLPETETMFGKTIKRELNLKTYRRNDKDKSKKSFYRFSDQQDT